MNPIHGCTLTLSILRYGGSRLAEATFGRRTRTLAKTTAAWHALGVDFLAA